MVYLTMSMQGMIPYLNSTNTKWEAHLTIEIRKETNVKLKCYWNGWTWNDLIISWFSANPNEWNLMADSVFFFLHLCWAKWFKVLHPNGKSQCKKNESRFCEWLFVLKRWTEKGNPNELQYLKHVNSVTQTHCWQSEIAFLGIYLIK